MTNHWNDYANSDVILAIGANPAENHPLAIKWIDRARERRGAKFIVVDPRYSRTAQHADLYIPLRPGTDVAFLGGMIRYALENGRYNKEYLVNYTNAAYLVDPGYSFQDGYFSGAAEKDGMFTYATATWTYQKDASGQILTDPTLEHPRTVFQLMKEHFRRYDIKTVCSITGSPEDLYRQACELFTSTWEPGRAGNILYAMGITQSTHGTQNVRSIAILQLLLGNIGIAGGGVNAQRGESNVQGSTDMALMYQDLPGYNPAPTVQNGATLAQYLEKNVPKSGYWANRNKFLISLLKAWWGEHATPANDFAYDFLPKSDGGNHSHIALFEDMAQGKVKGLFLWGQNPAVGGPHAKAERAAMANLDWLVVIDLFETESANFWRAPGIDPTAIRTEVFLLPAAASFEKQGSITNSGRWIQWRYQALKPPGEARPDLWIADRLYKAIRAAYAADPNAVFPDPILKLNWNYGDGEEPDVVKVAVEINGYTVADGKPVANFTKLAADGSTACGNWIYSGYYADLKDPAVKRRQRETAGLGLHPKWGYAWPLNRRILYNRCSADAEGRPWDEERWLVRWDGEKWETRDVPDFGWKDPSGNPIPPARSAVVPFIMLPEGKGRLFATAGVNDGPFPEHYEPMESPVRNALSPVQHNPAVKVWKSEMGVLAQMASPEFPYIATTFRLTEHWQSGAMTRKSPWLSELQPEVFVEISPSLARKLGIRHGEMVRVSTIRGAIELRALVTERIRPLVIQGREYEIVGMPWHWGYVGLVTGATVNDVTPSVGDPNTTIPEYKAFLCNITRVGEVS